MLDYIIIALLVLTIILLIILLIKRGNNMDIVDRMSSFEKNVTKDIGDFKYDFASSLKHDFERQNETIKRRLSLINHRVNERLDVNFEKTNKTFTNVLERLSKIDEAQKKIDGLSTDIISLQSILTDKKTRGIFGKTNLNMILKSVFGEQNDAIYRIQYSLPNSTISDAILFAQNHLVLLP